MALDRTRKRTPDVASYCANRFSVCLIPPPPQTSAIPYSPTSEGRFGLSGPPSHKSLVAHAKAVTHYDCATCSRYPSRRYAFFIQGYTCIKNIYIWVLYRCGGLDSADYFTLARQQLDEWFLVDSDILLLIVTSLPRRVWNHIPLKVKLGMAILSTLYHLEAVESN